MSKGVHRTRRLQLLPGAAESRAVLLRVAKFAAVLVHDALCGERLAEGRLTEASLPGDRRHPDIDETRDANVYEAGHELIEGAALVADTQDTDPVTHS